MLHCELCSPSLLQHYPQRIGSPALTDLRRMQKIIAHVMNALAVALVLGLIGVVIRNVRNRPIPLMAASPRPARPVSTATWDSLVMDPLTIGDPTGRIVVAEFSDYECPFCRRVNGIVDSALAAAQGTRVVFLHFPLPQHPRAEGAARAAICAGEQGRFPEMHHTLMTTSDWRQAGDWRAVATTAGVPDLERFERCLSGPTVHARLARDQALARHLGVRSTPTFLSLRGTWVGAPNDLEAVLKP